MLSGLVTSMIPGVGTVKLIGAGLAVLLVAAFVGWVGNLYEQHKVDVAKLATAAVVQAEAARVNADLNSVIDQLKDQQVKDDAAVAEVSAETEARTVFVTKVKREIQHVVDTQTVPAPVPGPSTERALCRLRSRSGAADVCADEGHQAGAATVAPVMPTKP
jgi:hypothetical protein